MLQLCTSQNSLRIRFPCVPHCSPLTEVKCVQWPTVTLSLRFNKLPVNVSINNDCVKNNSAPISRPCLGEYEWAEVFRTVPPSISVAWIFYGRVDFVEIRRCSAGIYSSKTLKRWTLAGAIAQTDALHRQLCKSKVSHPSLVNGIRVGREEELLVMMDSCM
jgi:hypothetical protein